MDLVRYVTRFLFQHLIYLILGSLLVGVFVYYLSRGWKGAYEVNTTVYTGVTSSTTADGTSVNVTLANNNMENLLNIIRSRSTLERVSLRLFAQGMIHGDSEKDNIFISAASYRNLIRIVPEEVKKLIDKNSETRTVENLFKYLAPDKSNFIYGLLNWYHPHYSVNALKKISVRRISGSDMLEISYATNDPGIAYQTLMILNEEFVNGFSEIRYHDSNEIIRFFEEEVAKAKKMLDLDEDSLLAYQMKRRIVNYEEQTEALASLDTEQFISLKDQLMQYAASESALALVESQMQGREKLFNNNSNFITLMSDISSLSAAIVRTESLMSDSLKLTDPQLLQYKKELARLTQELRLTSQNILVSQNTKEGIASENIVLQWLDEKIAYEKAKASLEVLNAQQSKLDQYYDFFSPIGAYLKRKGREINVAEESYLQLTEALISARLRLKNLQMSMGNVSIVSPPIYPLDTQATNRRIIVFATAAAALVFILCLFLIVEMIDRTLKNVFRAKRLIGYPISGSLPKVKLDESLIPVDESDQNTFAAMASHIGGVMMKDLVPGEQAWINIWSCRPGVGKSTLCTLMQKYFSEVGYKTTWIQASKDYIPWTKTYFEASSPGSLASESATHSREIFLLELPPAQKGGYPNHLLRQAQVNILICDAEKGWHDAEIESFERVRSQTLGKNLVILNRSIPEDVELYIGLLPPYTWLRKIRYRLENFELSSRWTD